MYYSYTRNWHESSSFIASVSSFALLAFQWQCAAVAVDHSNMLACDSTDPQLIWHSEHRTQTHTPRPDNNVLQYMNAQSKLSLRWLCMCVSVCALADRFWNGPPQAQTVLLFLTEQTE